MLKKARKNQAAIFTLFSLLYLSFAATAVYLVTDHFVQKQAEQAKDRLQQQLALVRSNIEAEVFRDTFLADSLATVVSIAPEFALTHWESVAEKLLSKARFVRNVGLAPDDVISRVYPLQGNEKAVGLDFRSRPEQYKTVLKARQSQQVVIAGPLELVQGGIALIARFPIFTNPPFNTQYWGSVSVVIDYDRLLQSSGIMTLDGLDFALSSLNPEGKNRLLLGNQRVAQKADIRYPVHIPNGNWELAAVYDQLENTGYVQGLKQLLIALGTFTFICIYILLVFLFLNYRQLHRMSLTDELTWLPNRRFLMDVLTRLMERTGGEVEFTLLNIDLNGFKKVNDVYGHEAGDELLRLVAHEVSNVLRSSDIASRIGGDEFVVILHRTTNATDVERIIGKIHERVESTALHWQGEEIYPSLSIGYTGFRGKGDVGAIKDLMARADQRMYQDKILRKAAAC